MITREELSSVTAGTTWRAESVPTIIQQEEGDKERYYAPPTPPNPEPPRVIDYKRRTVERYSGRVSLIPKENLSNVTSGACH